MRKLKLFLSLLMVMLLSVGNVWAGEVTISPTQALNDGGVDPITISCAKGDGTSNPAISSGQLRLYQAASGKTTGNTITFSSESAITSIVFTFANNMTASNGAFSEGSYDSGSSTWTGSADEFFGVAIRKGNTDLLSKVNATIKEMIADGTMKEIYVKVFGVDLTDTVQ